MKKTLIPLLALALSGAAGLHAQAQETVTSVNMVGMIKTTVPADSFEILSLPLTGTEGKVTLENAFGSVPDRTTVFLWVNQQYTTYTYLSNFESWFDTSLTPANNVEIEQGSSFWIKTGSTEAEFIHAGEVPSEGSVTINFNAGYNLVSFPYPTEVLIGNIDRSDILDRDVIFFWNGSGYSSYTYLANFDDWFDTSLQSASSVSIDVSKGFWLQASGNGSITFTKPY